jgi:hypothetical protein
MALLDARRSRTQTSNRDLGLARFDGHSDLAGFGGLACREAAGRRTSSMAGASALGVHTWTVPTRCDTQKQVSCNPLPRRWKASACAFPFKRTWARPGTEPDRFAHPSSHVGVCREECCRVLHARM